MYYIHDLYTSCILACETKEELAYQWVCKNGLGSDMFDNLNITGKDTRPALFEEDAAYSRRYQIFDDNQRSIDIRDWDEDVWQKAINYKPKYKHKPYVIHGHKRNKHRIHGPSLHYRTMRASTEKNNEYDIPKPRNKSIIGNYRNFNERKRHHSKSWKDQRKTRHQWQKQRYKTRRITMNKHKETDANVEAITAFWDFVKENNENGLMVVLHWDYSDCPAILAYFEPNNKALDNFCNEYGPAGEDEIPCSIVSPGAICVEITDDLLGIDFDPIRHHSVAQLIWPYRPTDFEFRTEW